MGFDAFKNEQDVITRAEACLDSGDPELPAEEYKALLRSYKKLFKTTKRLVSISDRSEERLKDANAKIKRQQKELERQNEILKENMKLREDVDRITRHDLKTPLNAIINFPKLIDKDNLTEKQVAQLKKISASGYKLLNMINLSLDLYKMEQGTYQFTPVPVNIIKVLEDIFQENRLFIKSRRIAFDIRLNKAEMAEGEAFELPGEELLLYSMLANLIKNALEASPRKTTIYIDMTDSPAPSIAIRNQGVVPADMRDNFFEKYATSGKKGGTGLGTYSAKLIMDTHGGTISMDSSGEGGTTLCVRFPGDSS